MPKLPFFNKLWIPTVRSTKPLLLSYRESKSRHWFLESQKNQSMLRGGFTPRNSHSKKKIKIWLLFFLEKKTGIPLLLHLYSWEVNRAQFEMPAWIPMSLHAWLVTLTKPTMAASVGRCRGCQSPGLLPLSYILSYNMLSPDVYTCCISNCATAQTSGALKPCSLSV